MKKALELVVLASVVLANGAAAEGKLVKCSDEKGKSMYQNWPCGTQPEIEKKIKKDDRYEKIVACGMAQGGENLARKAIGKERVAKDCKEQTLQ